MKRLLCIAVALLVACAAQAQPVANGVFLVAQPTLTAPAFRRTVILITQRPDGGSLGVILNRPTEIALRAAFPQHECIAAQPQNLYHGGPLQPQAMLFLVRTNTPPPASIAVLRDVYLTSDADWVNSALGDEQRLSEIRVFAGYAAWAPKQLRSEMERQGWYILPADSASIFEKQTAELWLELVKRAVLQPT